MDAKTIMDYEADPRAMIEALLQGVSNDPGDVHIHKRLHRAALRYKAAGGNCFVSR